MSEERTIVGQALQPDNKARLQGPSDAERLWMGSEVSLQYKIESILNPPPGDLHRLDLHLTAQDLITESCKRHSVQGMQQAHDILNRILFEKRSSDNIMIPVAPFEEVLFGWTRLAHSALPQKLQEVLRLMEQEHAVLCNIYTYSTTTQYSRHCLFPVSISAVPATFATSKPSLCLSATRM